MVNTNKLRGKIVEQGLTFAKLAQMLGVSPSTLGRKIKNLSAMTLEEVEQIRDFLGIPPSQIMEYFFSEHIR
ncbi:MAG: helix-turn-helix transcriptional regulator [Ruminococcaceae bacterium]|nr:helix-turn-helix transcriptional regulator [Oscillospiraceae bacterium]